MNCETILNVLTAVFIGFALCALTLHGLDALIF
jgi:multisubunit Na+/H+ antiporter MnhC subunit